MDFSYKEGVIINKDYIVKSTLLFDQIIKTGTKIRNKHLFLYFKSNEIDHPRFGIAVSKKLGNSVLRNKIRRQVKEIIRLNIGNYSKNRDYILIVSKNFINLSFNDKINAVTDIMKEELTK